MRLPADPRAEARRLLELARAQLPKRTPVGRGLDAFDEVPCARIPVWGARETRPEQ
jgi:hypothetical protein